MLYGVITMYRARRKKPRYVYSTDSSPAKPRLSFLPFAIVGAIMLCAVSLFLRELTTQIAISDASDIVTAVVNNAVSDIIDADGYDFDYFVSLDKNSDGEVTAISSNMAHINALSAQILDRVISSTENGVLNIKIPVGNLTGSNLLVGKGPDVSVDIIMLTSSRVDFKSEIFSSGINQTKYQLMLEVSVDIDVLIPWGTDSATVITEVLVADTVIVGKVPQTYLNMEK